MRFQHAPGAIPMQHDNPNTAMDWKAHLPLVAILRGLEPERAVDVAGALVDAGIGMIEVPMNSPEPLRSIAAIVDAFGDRALIGAGTVLDVATVDSLKGIGAQLVVSPNFNPEVVRRAAALGMTAMPGVLTPSEMFGALEAGATGLKIFPAELFPASAIKAVRAVLPKGCPILVVGGIHAGNMTEFLAAGATGFGLGSALFKPGKDLSAIGTDARATVEALRAAIAAA